jgi:hypothetical protein
LWQGLFLLSWCLLGCADKHSEEEHHVDHFVPPHRPLNLGAAHDRLVELSGMIARGEAIGDWRQHIVNLDEVAQEDLDKLPRDAWDELSDVVRWLPELAIDSDLSEADWRDISGQATELSTRLLAWRQASPAAGAGSDGAEHRSWLEQVAKLDDVIIRWRKLQPLQVDDEVDRDAAGDRSTGEGQ